MALKNDNKNRHANQKLKIGSLWFPQHNLGEIYHSATLKLVLS